MLRLLVVCLLVVGVGLRVSAHRAQPTQAKAAGSAKSPRAAATRPLKQSLATTPKLPKLSDLCLAEGLRAGTWALQRPGSQQLAEVQLDSIKGVLSDPSAEFDPEAASLPAALAVALRRPTAPLGGRRWRTRLVRTGRWATRREVVESLTCTDTGPLVLAQLPATAAAPTQVLAGPGYDQTVALRPLALTQAAVLRLCGRRAPQVRAYAMLYNLHFEQATEVARLLDYYNRIAVVNE